MTLNKALAQERGEGPFANFETADLIRHGLDAARSSRLFDEKEKNCSRDFEPHNIMVSLHLLWSLWITIYCQMVPPFRKTSKKTPVNF